MHQSVGAACPSCHTTAAIEPLEGRVLLHAGHLHALAVDPPAAPAAETVHLRINAGGKKLVDASGHAWERDRYGRGGGKAGKRIYDVAATADDRLFAQVRSGRLFRYAIPVPAGTYTLNLLFADPQFTAAGKRVFNVIAEDQAALANFDVALNGGGRSAIARSFPVTVTDGTLNLTFQRVVGKAIVSGIEVFQGAPVAAAATVWQPAAPVPLTLFEAQAAAVADKLYVFGGFHNGAVQATAAVQVYDPASNLWAQRANMPVAITHAASQSSGASCTTSGASPRTGRGIRRSIMC
jgi:hypothetical protein